MNWGWHYALCQGLWNQYPARIIVCVLATPLLMEFPADAQAKEAKGDPSMWAPATPLGDPGQIARFLLTLSWPPASSSVTNWPCQYLLHTIPYSFYTLLLAIHTHTPSLPGCHLATSFIAAQTTWSGDETQTPSPIHTSSVCGLKIFFLCKS